jgi:hypothetical protein
MPVDLGSGVSQGESPSQDRGQAGSPKRSAYETPAIFSFLNQMFGHGLEGQNVPGGTGQVPTNAQGQVAMGQQPQMPTRPASRLDSFENFLGNVLNSFSVGMSNAGTGPGAFGRGFGAAVQAPYNQAVQQYQMGQQQQAQQAQIGLQQSEAERNRAQTQMVQTPGGLMPIALAEKFYPALLQSQARVAAAGENRFAASPFGIYDRQTGQMSGGTSSGGIGATVKVTPELAKELGSGWDQLVGKDVTLQTLTGAVRAKNGGMSVAQGSEGAFLLDKAKAEASGGAQGITKLGQGPAAMNPLAMAKFQVSSAKDARTVETNQNQVNLAIPRLQNLRDNSDVLTNMIDAGKIDLSMGGDGIIRAAIGRNAKLTPREAKFAKDFQTMSEDIGLLRLPQGGGGFRSEEAFNAMQAQRGRLYENQDVFKGVVDNTLESMRAIQSANQNALDAFYAANPKLRPRAGGAGGPQGAAQDKVGSLVDKYK